MLKLTGRIMVAMLLAGYVASAALAATSLETLLKDSGFDYTRTEQGTFRICVSAQNETTLIVAQETSVGKDSKNDDLKLVYLFCQVLEVPKDFKHPPAMLKKLAELNDKLLVGKLSVNEQNGNIFYNSSFWLRTADKTVLTNELSLGHFNRIQFRKELEPFLKE
jgi:hypothetical protein